MNKLVSNLKYLRRPSWEHNTPPRELLEFIAAHPPGRAIDLGCGSGTNAIILAQNGWQVTAVDVAILALYRARRKAKRAKVAPHFRLGDAARLRGIREKFDLALDVGCFHNLGSRKRLYLNRLEQILAPNGFWLLYAHLLPRADNATHGISQTDIEEAAKRFNLLWQKKARGKKGRNETWVLFQAA
jgi:SAM-dependent methyltransferase